MSVTSLLQKRLILLSGKGGVGKTTVSVALGLLASRLKKKALLVEMNSTERVAPFFGLDKIGDQEIPLAPYLTGINLYPPSCFEEYVLRQVRFKKIFDTFVNNRFVTSFLNAVPGLNDLLLTGKIYDSERQGRYDVIIVDGPATGHGVSTFEVPFVVSRAVKVGPLRSQSDKIIKLLTDPKKTVFSVVTLAEEMPVVEAGELADMIKNKLKIELGPLFLNNFWKASFSTEEEEKLLRQCPGPSNPLYPYFASSLLSFSRGRLQAHYREVLERENPGVEIVTIPHIPKGLGSARDLKEVVDIWMRNGGS